jgi:hypothetical protein
MMLGGQEIGEAICFGVDLRQNWAKLRAFRTGKIAKYGCQGVKKWVTSALF